jgi:hypothetical protein
MFAVVFILLGFAYYYFQKAAILAEGRSNADVVVQMMADGDSEGVIDKLNEYIGDTSNVASNEEYQKAINSIDYITAQLQAGKELALENSDILSTNGYVLFSGVYSIENEQLGKAYLLIVLKNTGDNWQLANIQLKGDNPLLRS